MMTGKSRALARVGTVGKYVVLWAVAFALVIFPLWIVVVNSFKPLAEAQRLGIGLPDVWAVTDNYAKALAAGNLGVTLVNSVVITVVSVFFLVLFGAGASWIYARYARRRAVRILYIVSIGGILLPPAIVTTIPILRFFRIDGTQLGLIVFYVGWLLALTIFLCTGFVKTIPRELEDAARMDGATNLRTFFSIILPLMRPVLLSIGTFLTIVIWNELFYALFILRGDERQTVVLGLFRISSAGYQNIQWNLIFAFLIICSLPLLAVLIVGPRKIAHGMMAGSVK